MKHIKKVITLLLAVVMTLAMSSVAFAAGDGSITINNAVSGHTYTAYQILKGKLANGKLSDVQWGEDITEAGKTALYTKYSLTGVDQTAAKVAEAIAASTASGAATADDSKAIEFAEAVGTNVSGGTTGSLSGTTYTINNLADGYYMIVDTYNGEGTQGKDYTLARYMVKLVGTATVNNKADKPTADKKIVEGNEKVEANTANIGDKVNYEVTSKVPEYSGYKEYYMDFEDTMSKGLTFNDDVKVFIGNTELSKDDDYTVTKTANSDGSTKFTVHLNDLVSRNATVGAEIKITYSGTVNDNAVIGNAGNPNTMKLKYSNDPKNSGNGTPDDNTPGNVNGETPEEVVKTFVTEIELTKVDGSNTTTKLAGAVFNIKGTSINKVIVKGEKFTADAAGSFYLLKDGTYTDTAPTDSTKDQYAVDDNNAYKRFKKEAYTTTSVKEENNVEFQAVTGADGIIKVTGLGEGTYTFTEIQAPDGYNKLDTPITVVVKSNADGLTDLSAFAWSKDTGSSANVNVDSNGTFKFTVENNAGSQLPETGGIGTVIFYVLGSILVIGSAIVLISRRRMASK